MAKIRTALDDFTPDPRDCDDRGPTKERLDRAEEVSPVTGEVRGFYDRGNERKQYTLRDAPIEKAWAKSQITENQYQAAKKFYSHWYRAGMAANLQTLELDRVFGGQFNGWTESDAKEFHRQRYSQAVQLIGQKASSVLERVVCHESEIELVGRQMGWGNRPQALAAALETLRNALDRLCVEWGIGP